MVREAKVMLSVGCQSSVSASQNEGCTKGLFSVCLCFLGAYTLATLTLPSMLSWQLGLRFHVLQEYRTRQAEAGSLGEGFAFTCHLRSMGDMTVACLAYI